MGSVELVAAVLFAIAFVVVFVVIFIKKSHGPKKLREQSARELAAFDDFGLTFRPADSPDRIGTLEGSYRGYRVKIDPDDEQRILVMLRTDSGLILDVGTGISPEGAAELRRADRKIDEAIARRKEKLGLDPDKKTVEALRGYVRAWSDRLCWFNLYEQRLGVSPIEGTTRHVRSISAAQIRQILPPLIELAMDLDGVTEKRIDAAPECEHVSFEQDPIGFGRAFLQPVAETFGWTVSLGDHGPVVSGRSKGRALELSIAGEGGGVSARADVGEKAPAFQLYFDPTDDLDDMTRVGEHLYVGPDEDTGDETGVALMSIPEAVREQLFSFVREHRVYLFAVAEGQVEIELIDTAERINKKTVPGLLEQLEKVVEAIEG
jgi:hypothetical protein